MNKCCEWFKKEKCIYIKDKGIIYFHFCPNCGKKLLEENSFYYGQRQDKK